MVNKFLSRKSKYSIYYSDIDSSICSYIEKQEEVLLLKYPKIVYVVSENNSIEHQKSGNINNTIFNTEQKQIYNSSNNKFDKRSKATVKQEDLIEVRKSKVKFKKKVRSKIDIHEDDLSLSKSANKVLNEDSLDSIIQQTNYSKHKKKVKLKQGLSEYSINDTSDLNSNSQIDKNILIDSPLTIEELANKLKIPEAEIITWLFLKGISVTINQVVDVSIATTVALNYNFNLLDPSSSKSLNSPTSRQLNTLSKSVKRAPIITILGHVDHGKTTLLDTIRNSDLVKKEIGGITQSIAGYEVNWSYGSSNEKLVFLDTPGHEAFAGMRLRGTQVTDIALLVVAADDGLKPQTIEAIKYIQNNKLSCIVAINKVDKNDINIVKVKESLAQYNIVGEDWGGDIPIIEVSALTGKNIDLLLSNICMLSELQELKANPDQLAQGTVLEANLDKAKGPVAHVIVQDGNLKIGDIVVSHDTYGKVKAMINSLGLRIIKAEPSSVVELWGFSNIPQAGSMFYVVHNEKEAKQLISKSHKTNNHYNISKILNSRVTLDTYNKKLNLKQLNLIIKADTQGSIEAIIHCFSKIPQEKVQLNIIAASSGDISETDIDLAMTSNSLVIAFNTNIPANLSNLVNRSHVILSNFTVIYDLLDYIRLYMLDLIDPEYEKNFIGTAIVQTVFYINRGVVAGCVVNTGKLQKDAAISVYRQNKVVYNGFLSSLKHIKDDVNEVNASNECGVMCYDYDSWQEQDIIKAYESKEKIRVL
uniref:translation initiation factor IF-2 n=1 Tax=Polyopes affinis TaxID=194519 RepID=UPI002A834DCD|nr:translation initiation factor IF-2 [Polyopes affinis]WOL37102.1 translation initiation factor IF-2 [Polyopes affinis]